ncbi:MAG: AmmeMemoRadiSam system radical SAM enzyme [Bacilli bacterium]|nr:AmmeMemoRadiSam system radical SAM enzyme [Bacilli bacterium]
MKEALLYDKLPNGKVRCNVCSHRCLIAHGNRGICRVRTNISGVLYSLNYGLCIAAAIDPIEKKPLYHYLPKSETYSFAAVGCNMHCPWCQNYEISQTPNNEFVVEGDDVTPEEHIARALKFKTPSISYTYSEPTVFLEYVLETMKLAKEQGLKNIWVSNGFMSKETLEVILPYLDAINIDLKGPDDDFYQKQCGGNLKTILNNLKTMQKANIHIELTTLLIPGLNDEEHQIKKLVSTIVENLGVELPWHISRFFPAWRMLNTRVTPLESLYLARSIGQKAGLKYIYIGNV